MKYFYLAACSIILAYIGITIFIYFYQRNLLYHPSENNYLNENWIFPLCLVFGNEKNGISEEIKRLCDKLILIKTKNDESLNLSVANGIILSEIFRKYPK